MPEPPPLTEDTIRAWTGDTSYQRGWSYFRDGAIIGPMRYGPTLTAQCWGSMPRPYDVQATLSDQGDSIAWASCSCPVGAGGHCKHIAALLLTWIHQPDTFTKKEAAISTLQEWSKEQLVVLIQKMLAHYPDLYELIDLATIGQSEKPISVAEIYKRVRKAFRNAGDEWGAYDQAARQIEELVSIGDSYVDQGRWGEAITVYQAIARDVLEEGDLPADEGGDLHQLLDRCIDGLESCVAATEDPARRESVFRTLFEIHGQDVAWGGYGVGENVPLLICEYAKPDELRQVAQWIEAAIAGLDPRAHDWEMQEYGRFLLQVQAEALDDETYLRICRETGQLRALAERLLERQRVDDAMAAVRPASDYELLLLADRFVAHRYEKQAVDLVEERSKTSETPGLTEWLKGRAKAQGDYARALALALSLFWTRPWLDGYQEVKELAEIVGNWPELRPTLLAELAAKGEQALRTEIHLQEGEIDQCLDAVADIADTGRMAAWNTDLPVRVAAAAEASRPENAIVLYMEVVQALIAVRGRYSYGQAAQHLIRVRDLYNRLGKQQAWQALIASIRSSYPRLRALREELDRAQL